MALYDVPADYEYFCIPKINNDAFLVAHITDWEKYNLLEGEASVFFEDTYIGKTLLDVRYAADTLSLSLGRDKQVSVKREKIKDYTEKQFIGSKKEETKAWKTTVKNNKMQPVNLVIIDQVPVSTVEEIGVEVKEKSGAALNAETGEVNWKTRLNPNQSRDFSLMYVVQYPKYRTVFVE